MPIENVILTTDNCRYCLMCRHVCPIGHVTRLETLTPHGFGLTIASVRRGLLSWDEDTVDVLYSCGDCGTCRSFCVTDQPLPEAIAAARAEVVSQDLAPASVYTLAQSLREWGNPYQPQAPRPAGGQGGVALFVGDAAQYLWPGALQAALLLLEAVGIRPVLIGAGRNNGFLASSLGFPQLAQELAHANLAELHASGATKLLVLGPGDYFTFGQLYEERLDLPWPQEVILQELIVFLVENLNDGRLQLRRDTELTPYAYVDPTHTVRVPGRHDAPRQLLAAVLSAPARELFWRRERAHPVGSTALQFTQPHLAAHLTWARLEDARQSGAQRIISEDPGCLHALSASAARYGLQVHGLYELLADHLS